MKYLLKFLIISLFIVSCTKKEVKIPLLAHTGLQEVKDFSQVWVFFYVKSNDTLAEINRKNTISSTNWVYNIDRRLPLKLIVPALVNLKDKHANSLHSKEGMHNYFSYSDSTSKTLSFFEFDSVIYNTNNQLSIDYVKKNTAFATNSNAVHIIFGSNSICINNVSLNKNEVASNLKFLIAKLTQTQTVLYLNFSNDLLFQDYLNYKIIISKLASENVEINDTEFIVDPKSIMYCNPN